MECSKSGETLCCDSGHNKERYIETTLHGLIRAPRDTGISYEIIVVDGRGFAMKTAAQRGQ